MLASKKMIPSMLQEYHDILELIRFYVEYVKDFIDLIIATISKIGNVITFRQRRIVKRGREGNL